MPTDTDAYLPWASATKYADASALVSPGDSAWIWVLLELNIPAAAFARQAARHRQSILVPAHYAAPPASLAASRFCTALCRQDALPGLLSDKDKPKPPGLATLHARIKRFEIGFLGTPWPGSDGKLPIKVARHAGPRRSRVLGIVDDGIAFANERFRMFDGLGWRTRLLSLWDQGAKAAHAPTQAMWAYGRQHDSRDIDACFAANARHGGLDEDGVYARAGYSEVRHRATHGTHVLDLAAGADPRSAQEQQDAPAIVAVQLPSAVLEDTSCASLTVFVLDALRHIFDQAEPLPGELEAPALVVNVSLGNIAGPHDGSSIFEQAMDELIELRRAAHGQASTEVVLPAGNSHLARCHSWADLEADGMLELAWRLMPADGTPSFMEIWLTASSDLAAPPADLDGIQVTLTPPLGSPCKQAKVSPGASAAVMHGGCTVALVNFPQRCANGKGALILIAIAPTAPRIPTAVAAPCGVWDVRIDNGRTPLNCNAYIQRDDVAFGHRGFGRQSVFEDAFYQRFDRLGRLETADSGNSYLRRVGTLNGLATGRNVRVVGAAQWQAAKAQESPYSSAWLPTVPRAGSSVFAVADDSLVLDGVLAAGTRSGSFVALNGTSVAVPQVCRVLLHPGSTVGPIPKFLDRDGQHAALAGELAIDPQRVQRQRRRRG